ncbi:MAG: sugar phosphate isomerase/epimerase [Ferruginibacter sp.]
MYTRRSFIKYTGTLSVGSMLLSSFNMKNNDIHIPPGIQLYTVRKEMLEDAVGTLKKLAALGIRQIESAASDKGYYYGLKPKEIKKICSDLGMTLRSGHIRLDNKWQKTMEDAVITGQQYLICSSLPMNRQTVDNYKFVANSFNVAGEAADKLNMKFGYHNHDFEFEKENGKVLYDVLLENTNPKLVCMELDLGWVVATGNDPVEYFNKYPGRFPLWHLKDMDLSKKQSTEFGKGGLDIKKMFDNSEKSGLRYFFIEQEEYTSTPLESMQENMDYLKKMKL